MQALIATSLKFRLAVLVIAAAVLGIGITQLRDAPADVLPEFTPPYVEIQTEALGLSADEVEQLITVPLEADLLNGVQGVETIRSKSLPGLSTVVLVFEPGTDLYRGRQLVQERLTQLGAAAWPMISKPPTVLPPESSSSRVLMIGLSSSELTPIEQSVIARWTIKPRLMGVPGVANVAIWGMRDQQLQVQVDPERLREENVRLSQVISTAGNAQIFSPLSYLEASTPGTGGFIETAQQRLAVRNVLEQISDPSALGRLPVEGTSGQLTLADVAEVKIDHQPLIGDAIVNGGPGLVLVVEKFPGADTRDVIKGVDGALDRLRPGLSGLDMDTSVFRPSDLIDDSISNLTIALAIAGALLLLAVGLLLFQWRTLVVAAVTVPLALVAAGVVLDQLGESFNAISLAGLAGALFLVIDDAVSGANSVTARLLARTRSRGAETVSGSVLQASVSGRGGLIHATLIALLVVAPLAAMSGSAGEFFGPAALAYGAAVVVAALVAVTVTPALSLLLWKVGTPRPAESPVGRFAAPRYGRALSAAVGRPWIVLAAAGACVVLALAALPVMHSALVPSFKDSHLIVKLDAEPGTSNPRMTEITTALVRDLESVSGVEDVVAHVGRAITGDQIVDVNSSEVWVTIASGADYDGTVAAINDTVDRVEGVGHDVTTSAEANIRAVGALTEGENRVTGDGIDVFTGIDQPLVVRVYGQDLATLQSEAERVREAVASVDGVDAANLQLPATQQTLEIEVDLEKARAQGITPGDVRRAETTLLQGLLVGSVFEAQKVFDVVVQGVPETRASPDAVRNLLIDTPDGGHVRLGEVADVRIAETPVSIDRDAVSRRLDIVAEVGGRSVGDVAVDIEQRLADMTLPLEYHAEVLQRSTGAEIGSTRILVVAIGGAIAVFLLLQAALHRWRLAAIAVACLPLALVGGVVGALIARQEISIGSLIGFIALLGLAARWSVLTIRHFQDIESEGEEFGPGLVVRGALDRLETVMTSAVAVAAVALPLVILGGGQGLEVLGPMAAVMLGGVVSLTMTTLVVLPALYLLVGAGAERLRPAEDQRMRRHTDIAPAPAFVIPAGQGGGTIVSAGEGGPPPVRHRSDEGGSHDLGV